MDGPILGTYYPLKDRDAFKNLYNNYSQAIFGEILRIVKHRETSEDILQDVFLSIWQKSDQFDPSKGALFTWMISITRHKCIDHLRKTVTNSTFYPIENIEEKLFDHRAELLEFSLLFKHCQKIPLKYMELVRLIYVYGYTHMEVSEKCHIPIGTVKTTLRSFISKTKAKYSI